MFLSRGFESAHGLVLHRPALDVAEGMICLTKTFLDWKFCNHILKKKPNCIEKAQNPTAHTPSPATISWKLNTLSIYSLLFLMSSVDLSACPGSAPRDAHQSHVAISGERAGGDGAAELALPGGDGQFPAQHSAAAEDSD